MGANEHWLCDIPILKPPLCVESAVTIESSSTACVVEHLRPRHPPTYTNTSRCQREQTLLVYLRFPLAANSALAKDEQTCLVEITFQSACCKAIALRCFQTFSVHPCMDVAPFDSYIRKYCHSSSFLPSTPPEYFLNAFPSIALPRRLDGRQALDPRTSSPQVPSFPTIRRSIVGWLCRAPPKKPKCKKKQTDETPTESQGRIMALEASLSFSVRLLQCHVMS